MALTTGLFACGDDATDDATDDAGQAPGSDPVPSVTIAVGEVAETSIEVLLSAAQADDMAYCWTPVSEEMSAPEAAAIFDEGQVAEASATPVPFTISDLEEGKEYVVYAAARKGETLGEVKEVRATTAITAPFLSIGDVSKTGFSYSVLATPDDIYYHTYIEGWMFEYLLTMNMAQEGPEFNWSDFLCNLLADYGLEGAGPRTFEWQAGDEHAKFSHAWLVPGKKYYVVAGFFDEAKGGWIGTPQALDLKMPDPGVSAATVVPSVDDVSSEEAVIRMECDEEKVNFFFYGLYEKESFDGLKAEKGERGIMDYLYEYGQPALNTYTDTWEVEGGKSYMLGIYGVDYDGDEFYTEMQVDAPAVVPEIHLTVVPHQRELQGYHTYDTFLLTFAPLNFTDLDVDRAYCSLMPVEKAILDQYLPMLGFSLEQMEQDATLCMTICMQLQAMLPYLFAPISDDKELASLSKNGFFERVCSDLKPDTEYVVIAAAFDRNETPYTRVVTARTEPQPGETVASEAYNAFLGNWTLTGKTTADWTTYETYNLRVEALTPERSFKVYGWGHSALAEQYPFEMRYDPQTQKVSVETPQYLGQTQIGDQTVDVIFTGKVYVGAAYPLQIPIGYTGPAYTGSISGDRFSMFAEMLYINGYVRDFTSMSYVGLHEGKYVLFEGHEEDLVYFSVSKASEPEVVDPAPEVASTKAASVVNRSFAMPETGRANSSSARAGQRGADVCSAARFVSDPAGRDAWLRQAPMQGVTRIAR